MIKESLPPDIDLTEDRDFQRVNSGLFFNPKALPWEENKLQNTYINLNLGTETSNVINRFSNGTTSWTNITSIDLNDWINDVIIEDTIERSSDLEFRLSPSTSTITISDSPNTTIISSISYNYNNTSRTSTSGGGIYVSYLKDELYNNLPFSPYRNKAISENINDFETYKVKSDRLETKDLVNIEDLKFDFKFVDMHKYYVDYIDETDTEKLIRKYNTLTWKQRDRFSGISSVPLETDLIITNAANEYEYMVSKMDWIFGEELVERDSKNRIKSLPWEERSRLTTLWDINSNMLSA